MRGCDGQRAQRENRSGCGAPPSGRPRAALPRVRGPVDPADRRPTRSLSGDGQGVLLRSHRRKGAGGQGALRRHLSGLRGLHAAAERQGRRVRVLQSLPPGRDRAALDAPARARCGARMAQTVRTAAVVLRLVAHTRSSARRRAARAPERRRLAFCQRGDWRVRKLDGGADCRRRRDRPSWRRGSTVATPTSLTTGGQPGGSALAIADERAWRYGAAAQIGIQARERSI